MSRNENKIIRRRIRNAYLSSVVWEFIMNAPKRTTTVIMVIAKKLIVAVTASGSMSPFEDMYITVPIAMRIPATIAIAIAVAILSVFLFMIS